MPKMICFDLDGTIADLYNVPDWLEKLRNEDVGPYVEAMPMVDMAELRTVLEILSAQNWEIRVISWLAKDSTEEYKNKVRIAKREWLEKYDFPTNHVHLVSYGTTKANCVRKQVESTAILIDDSEKVRNGWTLGDTIDPETENIIDRLWELVEC